MVELLKNPMQIEQVKIADIFDIQKVVIMNNKLTKLTSCYTIPIIKKEQRRIKRFLKNKNE